MNHVINKIKRKKALESKSTKKKFLDSVGSIHERKMKHFENLQEKVLPLKLKLLKTEVNIHTIKHLKRDIKDIQDSVEEIDYLSKVSGILSEYFSKTVETSENTNEMTEDLRLVVRSYYEVLGMDVPDSYAVNTNEIIADKLICKGCNVEHTQIEGDGFYVCGNCGLELKDLIVDSRPSFKDLESFTFCKKVNYKRINYFNEWLSQIQGEQKTQVPDNVASIVSEEISRRRITNTKDITPATVKSILKKANYSKYYEHIPSIIYNVSGMKPLNIPEPTVKKLKYMFYMVQEPWSRHKAEDRHNFFSYPYTIHKFFQILCIDEFLDYFPLLKSREKIVKQEIVWKKIMDELEETDTDPSTQTYDIDWRFIPSI
jgi:rRNA maturation endonuclease Nob1